MLLRNRSKGIFSCPSRVGAAWWRSGHNLRIPYRPVRQVDVFCRRALPGRSRGRRPGQRGPAGPADGTVRELDQPLRPRSCCRPPPPGRSYRLRIFTPDRELPFAGHPTWARPARGSRREAYAARSYSRTRSAPRAWSASTPRTTTPPSPSRPRPPSARGTSRRTCWSRSPPDWACTRTRWWRAK
ncbi:PhzF family phenazine biosynthesis protein [Kocuria rhizophila]|nr:PhzF family phenazine biosynthesis protein [Kocuria rhizophila]